MKGEFGWKFRPRFAVITFEGFLSMVLHPPAPVFAGPELNAFSQRVHLFLNHITTCPASQPNSGEDSKFTGKLFQGNFHFLGHILTLSIQHGNKLTDKVGDAVGKGIDKWRTK